MEALILDVETFPEPVRKLFSSSKVRVEKTGSSERFILEPVVEREYGPEDMWKALAELQEMYKDINISSASIRAERDEDMELEKL
ncbi:MAG: hypothetical protein FWB74_09760 [Defluviitaleaceae bacterium]|nr:hypothetical protein [Defluviitaleaceae bacterium]